MRRPERHLRTVARTLLIALATTLVACQSAGIPELFRVGTEADGLLYGPWAAPSAAVHAIGKNDEVFTVVLQNAYFKYLPDILSSSEVMVIFEFHEGPIGRAKPFTGLVKIVGPLPGVPDGGMSPAIGPIVYGPKKLENDQLMIRMTILELDSMERTDRADIIKLIGGVGSTLSLANPVTVAEIEVAQQIATTLNDLDQNDSVATFEVYLAPRDNGVAYPASIPFKPGEYAWIQREAHRPLQRFFHLNQTLWWDEPIPNAWEELGGNVLAEVVALPLDLISLPFVAFSRLFLDVPDGSSLRPLRTHDETDTATDDGRLLAYHRGGAKLITSSEPGATRAISDYEAKTWLTFAIQTGQNEADWKLRKALMEADRALYETLKPKPIGEIVNESQIEKAISALVEAKQAAATRAERVEFKSGIKHVYASAATTPIPTLVHAYGNRISTATYRKVGATTTPAAVNLTTPGNVPGLDDTARVETSGILAGTPTAGAYKLYVHSGQTSTAATRISTLTFHIADMPTVLSPLRPLAASAGIQIRIAGTSFGDNVAQVAIDHDAGRALLDLEHGSSDTEIRVIPPTNLTGISQFTLLMKHGLQEVVWR